MEYNSHLWAGASKSALDFVDRIQSRALKLIGDGRVASSITSLGHRRNVSCIHIIGKIHFLPVQSDCGTTYPQISFLNASIFQCLKQEQTNTFYYRLLLSNLYIYPSTLSFLFQANAVQCIYRGYPLRLGFAIKKNKKI